MAGSPRRRSLIGRSGAQLRPERVGSVLDGDDDETTEPPALETASELYPDEIDAGIEVVERITAGGGFDHDARHDSFAMDDPPSEEVGYNPLFMRTFEPATELIDRDELASGLRRHGHPHVLTIDDEDSLTTAVAAVAKEGDLVVGLGAGTITDWINALPAKLQERGGAA